MRRFHHIMLALIIVLCTGCGDAALPSTASPPTASPPVAVSKTIDPNATLPPTVASNAVAPTLTPALEQAPVALGMGGSVFGVSGQLLFLQKPTTLTETYELQVFLKATFSSLVSSTVTITFSYEGIVQGTSAPIMTLVVTPGITMITTTFDLQTEGQGRIYADFAVFTPANPQNRMPCASMYTYTKQFDILATHLGIFANDSLWGLWNRYLETARTTGYISEETYLERDHILHTSPGALVIDLNGIQQELRSFPSRPRIQPPSAEC